MPRTRSAALRVVPVGEWDDLVTRLRGLDTYTGAAHHRASGLLEPAGTRPVLLHYLEDDGEIALPLLLRPLPDGSGWDAASAYGYGGPVAATEHSPAGFGQALDAWARANDVLATFLRLHPLLGNARLVPPTAELVELGPTVAWDVTAGRDLRSLLHPHHRRAVRRAERAGVDVDVVVQPRALDGFRHLYEVTMRRQQADRFYFFPPAYWDALLADARALGLVLFEARLEGVLVAAVLCFVDGPWLHYHLGASSDGGRSVSASNRCFLTAAEWAQSRGMTRFHLGGGSGARSDSPLLTFKHRHEPAGALLPFHVAKIVHDPDHYARLAGTCSTAGFFPPWRKGR